MIRFLVDIDNPINNNDIGADDLIFEFKGTIDTLHEIKYEFEKKSPFDINIIYREGKYYQDTLNINIVAGVEDYAKLHSAVLSSGKPVYVIWNTPLGRKVRRIEKPLPYPSRIRVFRSSVEFRIEAQPYNSWVDDMRDPCFMNRRWNVSTIADTVWN